MKNILFSLVLIATSSFQLCASTPVVSSTLNVVAEEFSIVLNLDNELTQIEEFTIVNADREIVFYDSVEKYKEKVKYNLGDLPIGTYTLQIDGKSYVEYLVAVITDTELNIVDSKSYNMPSISQSADKVLVDVHFESEQHIQVAFYNVEGDLVYAWDGKSSGKFEKVFNLAQLKDRNYEVIVSTDHFTNTSMIRL